MSGQSAYLSTAILRVAPGRLTVSPSNSSVILIWQPRRDVWVKPKARSSMSSSSSLAPSSTSYHSGSTITWQVEQASEPSQAPSRSILLRWAISSTESPRGASTSTRSPPALMKVIFGISKALQRLIFQALNDYYRQFLLGAVSCHTGLDLVKAVAFERRFHGPVHPGLGEGVAG